MVDRTIEYLNLSRTITRRKNTWIMTHNQIEGTRQYAWQMTFSEPRTVICDSYTRRMQLYPIILKLPPDLQHESNLREANKRAAEN